jgi:type IV pilus assembly protein PilB
MPRVRIGELLVAQGRLDSLQLESALAHQRRWGGRLGRSIVALGFLPERALLDAVGAQLGVPVIEIGERLIPPHVLALVPERLVLARRVLPIARLGVGRRGPLVVALADPADLALIDELAFATGMDVKPALAGERDLDQAIARHYPAAAAPPPPH